MECPGDSGRDNVARTSQKTTQSQDLGIGSESAGTR